VRKSVSEEIAERIAQMGGRRTGRHPGRDGRPGRGRNRAAQGHGQARQGGPAATSGETKTGPAYAADGTLKTVSIPVDEPAAAPEPKPERKGRKPKAAKEPKAKSGHAHEGGGHARGDLETRAVG
jgi:hypothetical protein